MVEASVVDPDPSNPYVFRPLESGSFYHLLSAKIVKKNIDSYCFVTSFDFLS
jgi:hypothetical protein